MKFGKGEYVVLAPVINALKINAAAYRPVHRVCAYAELLFQLVKQFKRVARLAVHLVYECEYRYMAHGADFEQLSCLRLDTLCRVYYHDDAVSGSQCAVGVLRKILMSRSVKDIYAVPLIFELQHR